MLLCDIVPIGQVEDPIAFLHERTK